MEKVTKTEVKIIQGQEFVERTIERVEAISKEVLLKDKENHEKVLSEINLLLSEFDK